MKTIMTGAEILLQSLSNQGVDTIFGYPGSCVMPILDCLYAKRDTIHHVLVRHEQGAIHAAQGYAQISKKTGVALLTSGPGATNTVTGIADAMANGTPLVVITGQVHSTLLGTDAFQEVDIIGITHPITKWVYQVRQAGEIASAIAHAFYIASTGRPGAVLLDITKDAQTEKAIYIPQEVNFIRSYDPKPPVDKIVNLNTASIEDNVTDRIIQIAQEMRQELIWVFDVESTYLSKSYPGETVRSAKFGTMGFGLPAAIGVRYATFDKTVCLVVDSSRFQATIQELGVIMQSGLDIKIILLNDSHQERCKILNPDFTQVVKAYNIQSMKISEDIFLEGGIREMLNSDKAYLLEISLDRAYDKRPNVRA